MNRYVFTKQIRIWPKSVLSNNIFSRCLGIWYVERFRKEIINCMSPRASSNHAMSASDSTRIKTSHMLIILLPGAPKHK